MAKVKFEEITKAREACSSNRTGKRSIAVSGDVVPVYGYQRLLKDMGGLGAVYQLPFFTPVGLVVIAVIKCVVQWQLVAEGSLFSYNK